MSKYKKTDWVLVKLNKINSVSDAICYSCNIITNTLQFHHCEYRGDDLNNTLLDDLVLLCPKCHKLLHAFFDVCLIDSYDLRNPPVLAHLRSLLSKLDFPLHNIYNKEKSIQCKNNITNKLLTYLPKKLVLGT